ncbi:YbfB/YjiJ family MFS transporter [Pararhizobium sp.]|uniref:YbfB/YjiJ family MFS transporter n=1 Tax=Pararhizobium sp. TaxID=1977563 RepID=UPI0027283BA6|nr:YbfB/YjiJ family MFS transporter [Pararhizobium sp.]MDO9414890.1 YbfB/YjiJ family MFS transporter [Pararhizobium sp.]
MTTSGSPSPVISENLACAAIGGAIGMAVAMGFGRFSYTPILPGMMAGLGLSPADAGLVASANFIGYLAGAVLAAYGWAAGFERRLALGALAATALLLLAMGVAASLPAFVFIRFLAGVASAFAMIFMSGIVLSRGAQAGKPFVQSTHFGGVGIGIALSSLLVWLMPDAGIAGFAGWRAEWLLGAVVAVLGLIAVALLLPRDAPSLTRPAPEPPLVWTRPLTMLTLSYGVFGFGYVITATFLVAMARQGAADQTVEFLCWFITGISAAVSVHLWNRAVPRFGLLWIYIAGLLIEALGVFSTVVLPLPAAPLIGGVLLGATFIMITAYGLQIGRMIAPNSPRRALALMTAAFGVGQIAGPAVAGWLAGRTGSFTLPTLLAALALIFCALAAFAVRRDIEDAIKLR